VLACVDEHRLDVWMAAKGIHQGGDFHEIGSGTGNADDFHRSLLWRKFQLLNAKSQATAASATDLEAWCLFYFWSLSGTSSWLWQTML
jgi:hypothetical protein